jgi:hypothetical protein
MNGAIPVLNKKGVVLLLLQTHGNESPIYVFPEKELRGLSSNFHIYVPVTDLYFQDRSKYFPATGQADRSWEYVNRSQTHECGNWDRGRAIPFLRIFVSNFRYCVFAVQAENFNLF